MPNENMATLNAAADNYLRELVAFHEIINEIPRSRGKAFERWIAANRQHVSEENWNELIRLLGETGIAVTKAAEYLKESKEGRAADKFASITVNLGDQELAEIYLSLQEQILFRDLLNRAPLVNKAFLITAVSSFEILFGQIVRCVYQRNPTALPKSEYSFTLEELSQYSSINEARDALVTRKVESLLMESVDSWNKWMERTTNIEFSKIVGEWVKLREAFARRNILVHADGNVTKRYIHGALCKTSVICRLQRHLLRNQENS